MTLNKINVFYAKSLQTVLNTALRTGTRIIVIMSCLAVAADFRSKIVAFTRHSLKRATEVQFRHGATVCGRDINEIYTAIQRGMDGSDVIVQLFVAKWLSERTRSKAETRNFETSLA